MVGREEHHHPGQRLVVGVVAVAAVVVVVLVVVVVQITHSTGQAQFRLPGSKSCALTARLQEYPLGQVAGALDQLEALGKPSHS